MAPHFRLAASKLEIDPQITQITPMKKARASQATARDDTLQ
jgi:hypothetical protein